MPRKESQKVRPAFPLLFIMMIVLISMGSIQKTLAFQFSENTSILVDVRRSTSAWGDYDNDGDLDLAISGYNGSTGVIRLYINNGDGTFTIDTDPFPTIFSVHFASLAWGDYDNDGDLDLVVSGRQNSGNLPSTYLYENTNGTFAVNSAVSTSLTNVQYSALAWGDYDNDGDMDLVVTGSTNTTYTGASTILYKNDGAGLLTDSGINLPDVYWSSVSWGDYDNDGFLDLAIAGIDENNDEITTIFKNDGDGSFTNSGATIVGISEGAIEWGDYDNDGDLDLAISGFDGTNRITEVYENTGSDTFIVDNNLSLTGVRNSALSWNDYNNDGDLDLLVTGTTTNSANEAVTKLYENSGSGGLAVVGVIGLPDVAYGAVSFGDYDNDGDADLVLSGMNGAGNLTTVYENSGSGFSSPSPPQNLSSSFNSAKDTLTLSWDYVDNNFDSAYSYNVFITDTDNSDGSTDSLGAPMADLATGFRLVAEAGNAGIDNEYKIAVNTLPIGEEYNWGVQAISSNLTASVFSNSTFIKPGLKEDIALMGAYWSSSDWGDYDNDGDLDFVVAGFEGPNVNTTLYTNDGDGTFTVNTSATSTFRGLLHSAVAWGDYNNDGFLDLIITGGENGSSYFSELYTNNKNGTFTLDAIATSLFEGVLYGDVVWGDIDNDLDLDLVISGKTNSGSSTKVYENNDGSFTLKQSLTAVELSSLSFADYDNDGDLDLMLTGTTNGSNSGRYGELYQNTNGTFTQISVSLDSKREVINGDTDWGDYDNDGDLDLVITGLVGSSKETNLYKNTNGSFSLDAVVSNTLIDVENSSVAFGDYDGDGDLDLIVSGLSSSGRVTRLYDNNNGSFITNNNYNIEASAVGSLIWVDYNNDGKLDLSQTGFGATAGITKLYKNTITTTSGPGSLTGLTAEFNKSVDPDSIIFSWDEYTDVNNNNASVDYNLYLVNITNPDTLILAGADTTTGFRRSLARGNVGIDKSSFGFKIPDVFSFEDTYRFGVQAIDLSLRPGGFSSKTFKFKGFVEDTTQFFTNVIEGAVAWGDYDSDGDLDLVVSGESGSGLYTTKVYENDGGFFIDIVAGLTGVYLSSLAWGDYDNDGDLDLVMNGDTENGRIASIYERTENGFVLNASSSNLPQNLDGNLEWLDFDHDGDLDVFISDFTGYTGESIVCRNQGVSTSFSFICDSNKEHNSFSALGDYDNDGDLDLFSFGSILVSINNSYNDAISFGGIIENDVAWGDYDNDGDLDLIVVGSLQSEPATKLFKNFGFENTTYNSRFYVQPIIQSATVDFATDTLTIQIGTTAVILSNGTRSVTHNLYIASKADDSMFAAQMADTTTGYRRIAAFGNMGYSDTYKIAIDALPLGDFIIGVQEVETNFKGGPFSTVNFTKVGLLKDTTKSNTLTNLSESTLAWGDYDNDGDLDLAISGTTDGTTGTTQIFQNGDGSGNFVSGPTLTGLFQSAMAWADYDNDGDLDLIVSGYDGTDEKTTLYNNSGAFIDAGINFPDVRFGSVSWNDFDLDGDLDLAISGTTDGGSNGALTRIYLNDNNGGFTDSGILLRGVYNSAMEWADYNNDGFADLLVTGYVWTGSYTNFSTLYTNNGAGGFSDSLTNVFPDVEMGDINWRDYDDDGDLDVIIAGTTNLASSTSVTEYYTNDGDGTFTKDNTNSGILAGAFKASLASADYDNDGDIDVVISGRSGSSLVTKLYLNNNGVFSETITELSVLQDGDVEWADVNSDGELDLVISGINASDSPVTELYTSIVNEQNFPPTLPIQDITLSINSARDSLIVNWNEGVDLEGGPLSYNVHIENVDVAGEYKLSSVMADLITGYRRIPGMGNAGIRNEYKIGLLDHPVGTYEVRVQAIDAGFKSSALNEISEVVFSPIVFTVTDTSFVLFKDETNLLPLENIFSITDYFADSTIVIFSESPSNGTVFLDLNNDSTKNEGEKFLTESGIDYPPPVGAKFRYNQPGNYRLDSLKFYLKGTVNQNVNPDSVLVPLEVFEGTPTISGNTNENGWYLLANPFTTTVGELMDNVWTQGAINSDAPSGMPTLYTFSEDSAAYIPITTDLDTTTIDAGEGLLAFIFEDDTPADNAEVNGGWPKTLTNYGNPFGEQVSVPIKNVDVNSSGGTSGSEGFKLFGNPFGWDLSVDSLITALIEIDPLTNRYVYRWNPISKEYELEFSGGIKPYESVFIRTITSGLDASIALEYDDIYETVPTKSVVEQPFQFVLNHSGEEIESRSMLQFKEEKALIGIDPFDGYYLGSYASKYANLYMQVGDQNLTINNLPKNLNEIVEFPIYLDATVSGNFGLEWNSDKLPQDWEFSLKEVSSGAVFDLKNQEQFNFSHGVSAKVKAKSSDDEPEEVEEVSEDVNVKASLEKIENEAPTREELLTNEEADSTATSLIKVTKLSFNQKVQSKAKSATNDPVFILTINPLIGSGTDDGLGVPREVELDQNYPNPFNPTSVIRFGVPNTAKVQLEVFDILGRKVATLLNNETKQPGRYNVQFDARNLASGMYIYRLVIGDNILTKKMTLIK